MLNIKILIMKLQLQVLLFILNIVFKFVNRLLEDKDNTLSDNAAKSLSIISALLSSIVESSSRMDTANLASIDALSHHADKQLDMIYNA